MIFTEFKKLLSRTLGLLKWVTPYASAIVDNPSYYLTSLHICSMHRLLVLWI